MHFSIIYYISSYCDVFYCMVSLRMRNSSNRAVGDSFRASVNGQSDGPFSCLVIGREIERSIRSYVNTFSCPYIRHLAHSSMIHLAAGWFHGDH